jgi:hypothetical protein
MGIIRAGEKAAFPLGVSTGCSFKTLSPTIRPFRWPSDRLASVVPEKDKGMQVPRSLVERAAGSTLFVYLACFIIDKPYKR